MVPGGTDPIQSGKATGAFKWPGERPHQTPPSSPAVPESSRWEQWGQRAGVTAGIVAAILIYLAPTPAGLSLEGQRAFSVFVLCTVLWVTNALPYGITALLALGALGLTGAMVPRDAYAAFGSSAIFFLIGIFLIAGALAETGLSKRLALHMLRRFDRSPMTFAMGMMCTGAFATAFMPNQAVTAMLYPIATDVANTLRLRPKDSKYAKLLFFAMAWGAMVGGNLTFLGSSRAALALGMLQQNYNVGISFSDWMIAALPVVVLGVITTPLILRAMIKPEPVHFAAGRAVLERAVAQLGPLRRTHYVAIAVITMTITAWISVGGRRVDLAVIALLGAVMLFVTKVLTWQRAERHVYWNIVLMYGGAIALGASLDKTGAARWLLDHALGGVTLSPFMTIAAAALGALILSEVMSNAAAVAVVLPLAFTLAAGSGASPVALALAVSFGAGLDFIFPMSSAPNTIIFHSGYLRTSDFIRVGAVMTLASVLILLAVVRFWWPLIGLI